MDGSRDTIGHMPKTTANSSNRAEMGLPLGLDYGLLLKERKRETIFWNPATLSNCHIAISGMSGSGKTHMIRQFMASLPDDVEVDILDYHGDIDCDIPGTRSLLFSPHTKYGFNPLIVNPDPHYGGVNRAISDVIAAMNSTSNNLGGRQINVLTSLMLDTYSERGITADAPNSWVKRVGSGPELQALRDAGDRNALFDYYPTLRDVLDLARRRLRALLVGVEDRGDGKTALDALEAFLKTRASVKRTVGSISKGERFGIETEKADSLNEKHSQQLDACVIQFREYLEMMESGKDLDDAINYSNKELLQSVAARLEGLINVGLFEPNPPPWGGARVRRHILRPLAQNPAELAMFVRFRLQLIVREMMQDGATDGRLRRMIVLDESKPFNSEEMDNPINVIATQMRKFGLALMMASQSPVHLSDDFLKNAGTLLLLNMATADWDDAARRLKIDRNVLKFLKPREVAAIRMIEIGGASKFKGLYIN